MAEMDWARAVPRAESPPSLVSRLPKVIDWEAGITLVLLLGAVVSVAVPLEENGWSRNMPPLTTVAVISVVVSMLLARSRISMFVAWPISILVGAAVVFWQTLSMAGPGTLQQRLDSVYYRFEAWFDVVFSDRVTNDSLPFNVLVLAVTWLGVFIFGWAVYRWHNAWLGLIPGGVALFLDLVLVGDKLTGSIVLYMLFGFLLIMQTNLLANMHRWRHEGANYPPMINISFLHFSAWALIGLLAFAWILPTGPFSTPAPVQSGINRALEYGTDFVRLAGPLHSKKVIPIHSYSGVLPFQGSVNLGDRELLAVTIRDPSIEGGLLLRGSVYDEYEGGGWTIGERVETPLPNGSSAEGRIRRDLAMLEIDGLIVPLHIQLEAKSVVGTVIFTPGETIGVSRNLQAQVPEGAVQHLDPPDPSASRSMTDEEVLADFVPEGYIGLGVNRDHETQVVTSIEAIRLDEYGVLDDAVELDPGERIKRNRSYDVTAFVPNHTPEELRAAADDYDGWLIDQYVKLPDSLPDRVGSLAASLTESQPTAYDKAAAIEDYLRSYQIDYDVDETPPGADTVDHFLFESRRGYFDYHASAMVVMLRTLGIPARLAVGFAADDDDYEVDKGAYIVRDENSFAWPEVYFPDNGWVSFNPTPDERFPDVIAPHTVEDPTRPASSIEELLENVPAGIDGLVPPGQQELGIENAPAGESGDSGVNGFFVPAGDTDYNPVASLGILAFICAIAAAIFFGWQRSVAGLPYPQQLWEKTVRLASWGGEGPAPGQTPHDYARRLGKRFRGVEEWSLLADAYTRSRFGRKEIGETDAAALRDMWPDARGALMGGIFGRFFRRRRRRDDD
jgi:hypothetical protein